MHYTGLVLTESGTEREVDKVLAPFNELDDYYMTEETEEGYFVNPIAEWDSYAFGGRWSLDGGRESFEAHTFPIDERPAGEPFEAPHAIVTERGFIARDWYDPDRDALVGYAFWPQAVERLIAQAKADGCNYCTLIDYHV